jgi:Serpentine type 7TM GPCR chemoreceptor Str
MPDDSANLAQPLTSSPLVRTAYSLNCTGCFVAGLCLNLLLATLILSNRHTARELRAYARCCMLTGCAIDVALSTMTLVVQPVEVLSLEGANMAVQNGPLRGVAQPWDWMLVTGWLVVYYLAMVATAVRFIHRYLTLCRGRSVTGVQHAGMMGVGVGLLGVYVILHYTATFSPAAASVGREGDRGAYSDEAVGQTTVGDGLKGGGD